MASSFLEEHQECQFHSINMVVLSETQISAKPQPNGGKRNLLQRGQYNFLFALMTDITFTEMTSSSLREDEKVRHLHCLQESTMEEKKL